MGRHREGQEEEEEEEAFCRKISESLPQAPVLTTQPSLKLPFSGSLLRASLRTKEPMSYLSLPLP